jgi:DNA-binding IclR family transcriptional regulator
MGKHGKNEYSVQCVEHALDLLELYLGSHAELGVSALSRMMLLPKNKVFRLLTTLKSRDYIEQNQYTENYRLGARTLELRQSFVRHMNRSDSVRTLLESMAAACNETVCYTVLDNGSVLSLDKFESRHIYRASPEVGKMLPAYCTAAGKIMLAHLDDTAQNHYLSTQCFERYTLQTITDIDCLRRELRESARKGYAVARDELNQGMSSVASVIRDHTLRAVGAVTLICPSVRLTEERLSGQIVPLLLGITAGISGRLGYWSGDYDEELGGKQRANTLDHK